MYEGQTSGIKRSLVPEDQRSKIVADLFGLHWPLRIEPYIYAMTDQMAASYHGGYWQFYTLKIPGEGSPGFYMAPDSEETYEVRCQGNFFDGVLSADALGITACLCTYNRLSFSDNQGFGQLMAMYYHRLKAYMLEHAEAPAIRGAID